MGEVIKEMFAAVLWETFRLTFSLSLNVTLARVVGLGTKPARAYSSTEDLGLACLPVKFAKYSALSLTSLSRTALSLP